MPVGLLRGDEGPPRAVHDQQLSHNLLQCATQPSLDSNLSQDAGNHRLLRAQLFLLFGQISQQKAHDQKVDREHEKTFGLEIGSLDPELRQVTLQEQPRPPSQRSPVGRRSSPATAARPRRQPWRRSPTRPSGKLQRPGQRQRKGKRDWPGRWRKSRSTPAR